MRAQLAQDVVPEEEEEAEEARQPLAQRLEPSRAKSSRRQPAGDTATSWPWAVARRLGVCKRGCKNAMMDLSHTEGPLG